MRVIAARGDEIFIVEHNSEFYLINLMLKSITKANPPNMPDQFLKFGYFEEVDELTDAIKSKILTILQDLSD